jgi:hypothetical protein
MLTSSLKWQHKILAKITEMDVQRRKGFSPSGRLVFAAGYFSES